jgi:hypothetical protein
MNDQVPPGSRDSVRGGNIPPFHPPVSEPFKTVEEEGVVEEVEWDAVDDGGNEVRAGQVLPGTSTEEVLAQVLERQEEVKDLLCAAFEEAVALTNKKSELLDLLNPGVGQAREEMLRTTLEGGTLANLAMINVDGKLGQEVLGISACDLAVMGVEAWQDFIHLLSARMAVKESFNMKGLKAMLARVSDSFERGSVGFLGRGVTQAQWRELRDRHAEICRRLEGKATMDREIQQLFPKNTAKEILKWYGQLELLMRVLEKQQQEETKTSVIVSQMLDRYPGPALGSQEDQSRTSTPRRAFLQGSIGPGGGLGRTAAGQFGDGGHAGRGGGAGVALMGNPGGGSSFVGPNHGLGGGPNHGLGGGPNHGLGGGPNHGLGGGPNVMGHDGLGQLPPGGGQQWPSQPLSEGEMRREAAHAGLMFRMGGGGPGGGGFVSQGFGGGGPVGMLPDHLIHSKHGDGDVAGQPLRRRGSHSPDPEGSRNGRSARGMDEDLSSESYVSDESGWHGASDATIRARIKEHAEGALQAQGKYSPQVLAIIMDNLAPFRDNYAKGSRMTMIKGFKGMATTIKPAVTPQYICTGEWLKVMNSLLKDYQIPPNMKARFLAIKGGLSGSKSYDTYVVRVKSIMEGIDGWMPDYDQGRAEEDREYWTMVWINIQLKLIQEFFQQQPAEMIEKSLQAMMQLPEHLINSRCDDFLNTQFHKVHNMYLAMNSWLRERSSALVETPAVTWKFLVEWLERQTPGGPLMMVHIRDALRKLSTKPQDVIPADCGIDAEGLADMRVRGSERALERTLKLVLRHLKERALAGDLKVEYALRSQMTSAIEQATRSGGRSGGHGRSVNSATTGMSTLTMNTTVGGGTGQGATFTPCPDCDMFHKVHKDGLYCMVDKKGKANITAMMNHRSATLVSPDGKKSLSEYWRRKFVQFLFPKLNYSKEKGDETIKNLRAAIAKLPDVNQEGVRNFAKDQTMYVQFAMQEDTSYLNLLKSERDLIVSFVSGRGAAGSTRSKRGGKAAKKARKAAREAAREEEDSSDSEDEGSDFGSDS